MIARVAQAPARPVRRVFAVLIVDAWPVKRLLTARSSRARLDRAVCALVESALPGGLLRAGHPLKGEQDTKREALTRLALSIEEHMQPPEPSIPAWLSGRADS